MISLGGYVLTVFNDAWAPAVSCALATASYGGKHLAWVCMLLRSLGSRTLSIMLGSGLVI